MNRTLLEGLGWFRDPLRDPHQNGVAFLLADLDVALTFMDIAAASPTQETRRRNNENARNAYETVVQRLHEYTLDTSERAEIEARLASVKARLQTVGLSSSI